MSRSAESKPGNRMIPGQIVVADDPAGLAANRDLDTVFVTVSNTGDRPIQVGSHFHFFEVNDALRFDRKLARGFRLNIPAGTAVRFEAGDEKKVELVALSGLREVHGLNGRINGPLDGPHGARGGKREAASGVRRKT